jgi:hypothetical protein
MACSRFIDLKVFGKGSNDHFTKDAAGTVRHYYGQGSRSLYVDNIAVAPTGVLVDENNDGTPEVEYTSAQYQLMPLNAADGAEVRPWTRLYLPTYSTRSSWPADRLVQITAVFGWGAVPAAVARATIHLAAILRLETPRAQRAVSETGEILEATGKAQGIINELYQVYGPAVSF